MLKNARVLLTLAPIVFFLLREFEEAATKKYSSKYVSTEKQTKNLKNTCKEVHLLVKLQVSTSLKMSTPTGIFQGFCLVQESMFTL